MSQYYYYYKYALSHGQPLNMPFDSDPGYQKLLIVFSAVIFAKCFLLQILNPSQS